MVDCARSKLNPKYRHMQDEFVYRGDHWVCWTSEKRIREIEEEFHLLSSDLMIATYTKSGTTLASEIVSLLMESKGDEAKMEKALEYTKSQPVYIRTPFIDELWTHDFPGMDESTTPMEYLNWLRETAKTKEPRRIKTHLSFESIACALKRMPTGQVGPAIIYVYRNPKDTAVSLFNFYRGIGETGPFMGDWNEYFEMWLDGWITGGDWRKGIPTWLAAVKDADQKTTGPRMMVISYEALIKQPRESVIKMNEFIQPGIKLDDTVLETILDRTAFKTMKNNEMTNYTNLDGFTPTFKFMRSGKVGDWKRWFTVEQNERFDAAYAKTLAEVNLLLAPDKVEFE